MRNVTILIMGLLTLTQQLCAQPAYKWGRRGGSGGTDHSYRYEHVVDMTTDPNGNVYVLAENALGVVNVDGQTGISNYDRYSLASWNCDGLYRWKKTFGSAAGFIGYTLESDTLGGIYLAGTHSSTNSVGYTYFDTDTLLGNTPKSMFLVKYDTSGVFQWLKMPQPDTITAITASLSDAIDMSVSGNGDIYLYCRLSPGNYNGNAVIISETGYYVIKFNRLGVYQSHIRLDMATTDGGNPNNNGGAYNASVAHFARDHHNGRLYLAGTYMKDFGTLAFGTTPVTSTGTPVAMPLYVTAFGNDGANLWVKQSSPDNSGGATGIVIANNSTIYLSGGTGHGNVFGSYTFNRAFGNAGGMPYVMALDTNGNNIWVTHGTCSGSTPASAVDISNNTVAVAGHYGQIFVWQQDTLTAHSIPSGIAYPYIACFNAATGQLVKMDSIRTDSTLANNSTAVTADNKNNFYIGGRFMSRMYVGPNTLTKIGPGGTYDWFVAKFGTDNCDCELPQPAFTQAGGSGNTVNFTYTGSTSYTAISWDFGDGTPSAAQANPIHTFSAAGTYTVCVTVTNDCGSNTFCNNIQAGGVSSVVDMAHFGGIKLYPNPVMRSMCLEGAGVGSIIEIYSTVGVRMLTVIIKGVKDDIEVNGLPAGIYILRLTGREGWQATTKFVKQ